MEVLHAKTSIRSTLIGSSRSMHGVPILDVDTQTAELATACVTESHLVAGLADAREIATPLGWYPRLRSATARQRTRFEVSPFGIHWPELDEDLSVGGMLAGRRAVVS